MSKSSKNAKKQDLAEKVQEIQKRQKNWLKQREQHKQTDETKSVTPPSTKKLPPSNGNHGGQPVGSKGQYKAEYSVEKSGSGHTKDRFRSWMEERERSDQIKVKDDQEPDILHVSSSRSPGFATPDPDWDPSEYNRQSSHLKNHDLEENVTKTLMSHQDFDEMANKIVARVKNELDIPHKTMGKVTESSSRYDFSDNANQHENTSHTRASYSRDREDLSSHYCPQCGKLMLSSDNVPMILTPCAHSLCQSCCKGRSLCPQCACTISSKTCNIMLQQIIQNHHQTRERTQDSRKQTYSPDNYREKAKTRQQYQEEYENLQTRQEVLHIETREIQGHMTKLANKKAQQQQQIQNIEREEKKVHDKIHSLKEKLVELESHKREYDRVIDEIETEKMKDKNKLNMVQDTLSSIEIEMEKLRLILDRR